ncbi:MAG: thrombospondin type 3 repeat-containing protein, partial [Myxococcota bacterium]
TYVDDSDTGTDPLNADSDGDGMNDGAEIAAGMDPNSPDATAVPFLAPGAVASAERARRRELRFREPGYAHS